MFTWEDDVLIVHDSIPLANVLTVCGWAHCVVTWTQQISSDLITFVVVVHVNYTCVRLTGMFTWAEGADCWFLAELRTSQIIKCLLNLMRQRSEKHSSCFKTSNKAAAFIQYGDEDK